MSDELIVRSAGPNPAQLLIRFLQSTIGAKYLMALSGVIMWGFVIVHLIGNLQVFIPDGGEALNAYGALLHKSGGLLWIARGTLLASLVGHVYFGIRLKNLSKNARPVAYQHARKYRKANPASLSMAATGLIILSFIILHINHFTVHLVDPAYSALRDNQDRFHVYAMVREAFSHGWVVVVYIVGQLLLLSHLSHGTGSLFQSLGIYHNAYTPTIRTAGKIIAAAIMVGNVAIPLLLFFGIA